MRRTSRTAVPLLLFLLSRAAFAQAPPDNGRAFQDTTGAYGSQAANVEAVITRSGVQAKIFLSEPPPPDIDAFSHKLFRAWKLPANGLLLCIWPTSRKVAITAGAEVEQRGVNGTYIRNSLIPGYFKSGWRSGGLPRAIESTLIAVRSRLDQPAATIPPASSQPAFQPPPEWFTTPAPPEPRDDSTVLVVAFLVGFPILIIIAASGARRGRRPTGWGGPRVCPGVHHSHIDSAVTPAPYVDNSSSAGAGFGGSVGGDCGGGGFSDTGSGSF